MDKKLIISIGVLVVLLGFYFYDSSKQNSYQAGYTDIFDFDSKNIDSTWNINGHDSLIIKQRSIDTLFDKILKAKRSIMAVSDNPKDLSIYSLDDDECINIVFLDENGNTLSKATFGIWTSNYYSNYYRHPDESGVYKTDSNILTYITTNPMYWGEKPKAETIDSDKLPAIDIPADSLNSL